MPLAVLYIPSADLIRHGGRITDSGNIIVSRPVPFNLVKEAWFCMPEDNDRKCFELVEKIMDERLEDELVMDYQPSPILRDFKEGPDTGSRHGPALRHANWTSQRRKGEVAVCPCGLS